MKFTKLLWESNKDIYKKIISHPFNTSLMKGTLDKKIFAYYIEEDAEYLKYFAKALSLIASKMDSNDDIKKFLSFSEGAIIAEEEVVHEYFKKTFNFKNTDKKTTALIAYTNYLMNVCACEEKEVGLSALLPCFWVYYEVGSYINKNSAKNNPYKKWIDTYSGDGFKNPVLSMIDTVDKFASKTSDNTKKKMELAFKNAMYFEWHFWNDCYNLESFHNI